MQAIKANRIQHHQKNLTTDAKGTSLGRNEKSTTKTIKLQMVMLCGKGKHESGKAVGYKINTQKSLPFIYTNNERSEREIKETITFNITSKRMKYQGKSTYRKESVL